jgi:hypothetical protein
MTVSPQPHIKQDKQKDMLDEASKQCSDRGAGNALIHHSTSAGSDHTRASYVDTRFARHSQVASQGTGAVNVCNPDMVMY